MINKQRKVINNHYGYKYICESDIGVNPSEPLWSIYRESTNGDIIFPVNEVTGLPTNLEVFSIPQVLNLQYAYYVEPQDETAPNTPTISIASTNELASAGYTNTTDIILNITDDTDNVGVTGYYISENSTPPVPTAGGWQGSAPSSFTLSSGDGTKTVYVWTKDAQGNISNAGSDTITLDTTAPTASFTGNIPQYQNTSTNMEITFTEDMTEASISLTTDGGTISNIVKSGTKITFTYVSPNAGGDTIYITGTDRAGNTISDSQSFSLDPL